MTLFTFSSQLLFPKVSSSMCLLQMEGFFGEEFNEWVDVCEDTVWWKWG